MRRFINWLKAVFNRGMDRVEDPDIMLDQARRDMQGALTANRERAIQAITQRNQLEKMLQDQQSKSQSLENQAVTALKQGNRDLARDIMREKAVIDDQIGTLQNSYEQAGKTVEAVKVAIQRQQEEVQKKTAEALALKAQWKQAQIQNSIAKALDGLTFENQFEGFGAAQERIRQAQSEASARSEMHSESLQGRMAQMQDKTMDYAAEAELQKLEARLGMASPAASAAPEQVQTISATGAPADPSGVAIPAAPSVTDPAVQSEADKQLEELEKRIKGH
jgi:phage shock protein A